MSANLEANARFHVLHSPYVPFSERSNAIDLADPVGVLKSLRLFLDSMKKCDGSAAKCF